MKLTPEQKAFYEFGAAKAFLFNKIEEARNYSRRIYGESYCELTPKERADCWKHSEIKFFIKLVRERRAACRAWQVKERYCGNSKYSDYSEWDVPCCECSHANIVASIDRWEPRKEGES